LGSGGGQDGGVGVSAFAGVGAVDVSGAVGSAGFAFTAAGALFITCSEGPLGGGGEVGAGGFIVMTGVA